MNARVETVEATEPNASTVHDAMVLDLVGRGHALYTAIGETLTMSPDDRAKALGELLDEHDTARASIVAAREDAFRLAELESLLGEHPDAAEDAWNAANNGGHP